MHTTIDALNWRYATKQFDPEKKLSQEQIETLLESLRLTASSFGLQPWKFIVVTNPEVRVQLRAAAWGQPQITDASHLIVFAVPTDITDKMVDAFIASKAQQRSIPTESLAGYSDMIKELVKIKTQEERVIWATKQAYIALGTLLTVAAIEHIDTGGIEGFDAQKFDEILRLTQKNLKSVVIAPVGFRSAADTTATMKKVRYPIEEVVEWVK